MSDTPAYDVVRTTGRAPRLTIGLPVHNGEAFLAKSLDALLSQTYTDFELLISDNASTDGTEAICREYAARDSRIRYIRQPVNRGAVPNHNLLVPLARGELFKWASHDDVYAPTLVEACVEALDRRPDAVLAHSDDAFIDASGNLLLEPVYALRSDDPRPWVRLHSLLVTPGGNDFYGVIRTDVLRSVPPNKVTYNADRVFMAGLVLAGRFAHVPDVLYYRRDHPQRASRAGGVRARVEALGTRQTHPLRKTVAWLTLEYFVGLLVVVLRSPLPVGAKVRCLGAVLRWLLTHVALGRARAGLEDAEVALSAGKTRDRSGHRGGGSRVVRTPSARVAVFGYFGIGNLGNEGTLAAVLAHLRRSRPEAEVTCVAPGVEAVERDHGVPTIQMTAFRPDGVRGGVLVTLAKAASRLWDFPRTFRIVGRFDTVVVAGTGSLEAKLKVPAWGLPYWLFLTALCCRLRRRRFALVGVGVEQSGDPAIRFFYRWTLRLATFCSVRDEGSRRAVRALGARRTADRAEVAPDLAFSLTAPTDVPVRPGHAVVGVIAYTGPGTSVSGDRSGYVPTMSDLVTGLLLDGCTVTIIVGDRADVPVAEVVLERVRARVPDTQRGRVSISAASTMAEIMTEMAAAELVVASRFHNVIGALMLARPTVSLGYARKHAELMADFGFAELAHDLDALDGRRLAAQVEDARRRGPELQMRAKETLLRYEEELGRVLERFSREIEEGARAR